MKIEAAPLCHHVKANGTVCESPALKGEDFCYFHTAPRERTKRQRRAARLRQPFQLPLLEDANSIQLAIGETLNALLTGQIDHKTAGLVLYGLQTAAGNIRHTDFEVCETDRRAAAYRSEDSESGEEETAERPLPPIVVSNSPTRNLPPTKSPYSAEERELLDQACSLAMERARSIKEQFKKKG
jgi:hypothetical protein